MINNFRFILIFLLSAAAFSASAQTTATTSSPYSKFGLGEYQDPLLPQQYGMGGVSVANRKTDGPDGVHNDINVVNPASFSSINLTTIDIGAFGGFSTLSAGGLSQTSSNFRLGHVAFAIPVTKKSALSFGILPYANVGYNYRTTSSVSSNRGASGGTDTSLVSNSVYTGEGGLSKAYLGYGFHVGNNLSLGATVGYIFGKEKQISQSEFPNDPSALNTSVENSFSAGGISFDYGAQYNIKVSETRRFTIGYSGSAATTLNATQSYIVGQYFTSTDGTPAINRDSLIYTNKSGKIDLPLMHRFGISYQKDNKFFIAADYKTGQWSSVSILGANAGLANSQTFALGGQLTPNAYAISNYWAQVDYRLGVNYENTYINTGGVNIKQYGASVGFGLPIPNERRTSFYKVNFAFEAGRRGTLDNGLVRENFYNFHLGFTINDKWFQKYKFD